MSEIKKTVDLFGANNLCPGCVYGSILRVRENAISEEMQDPTAPDAPLEHIEGRLFGLAYGIMVEGLKNPNHQMRQIFSALLKLVDDADARQRFETELPGVPEKYKSHWYDMMKAREELLALRGALNDATKEDIQAVRLPAGI